MVTHSGIRIEGEDNLFIRHFGGAFVQYSDCEWNAVNCLSESFQHMMPADLVPSPL
jgi:hypothetical protein